MMTIKKKLVIYIEQVILFSSFKLSAMYHKAWETDSNSFWP